MTVSILAVDIGTTRTKYRFEDSRLTREDHWVPTVSPCQTVEMIQGLRDRYRATATVVASYRRAALDTQARPVLVRDLDAPPPPLNFPGTDAKNPLATLHRWKSPTPGWFSFDAWLSYQLTGRTVVAPSMAWLSGAWNVVTGSFDRGVLSMLMRSDRLPELPEVINTPHLQDGVLLPILGDHEATAISAFSTRGELNVVECGTAWASLVQVQDELSPTLGLGAPPMVGYHETIDPFLVDHLSGTPMQIEQNGWQQSSWRAGGDVLAGLASVHLAASRELTSRPIVIGGNAENFLSRIGEKLRREFEFVADGISPLDGLIRLARRTLT